MVLCVGIRTLVVVICCHGGEPCGCGKDSLCEILAASQRGRTIVVMTMCSHLVFPMGEACRFPGGLLGRFLKEFVDVGRRCKASVMSNVKVNRN